MRIAQFVGSLLEPLGGAEQYCLELARWQRDQGHEVTIITGWVSPGIEKSLAAEGLTVRLVRSRRPYPPDRKGSKPSAVVFHALDLVGGLRVSAPLRRVLAEPWDVVHVHRFAGFGAAMLRSGRPTVMTVHDYGLVDTSTTLLRHGREVEKAPLVQRIRTSITNRSVRSARLIFPTERLRQKHAQWGLELPTKTDVIPHGWRGSAPSFTEHDGPVIFLFLGKLIAPKGIELLLSAWAEGIRGAELWVAGAGELESVVQAHESVRYLGWLDDTGRRAALAAASVLVLPSTWPENFPLSAAEGVLAGLPLISTTIAAPPVLHEGVNGLLAQPDAAALRSALLELLDPVTRGQFAAGSREIALALDFDTHGRRIEALYEELLEMDRAAS
ncbi:MAG: glycosyltransferase family 4 protein [Salinibacterium sp.]|nr:glycosyltransferase family 4 protein [Salinibacterium sp.]